VDRRGKRGSTLVKRDWGSRRLKSPNGGGELCGKGEPFLNPEIFFLVRP